MALRYYDEAVQKKISSWVADPNMKVLSPADSTRLFQMQADLKNDSPITLPMIAISRDSDVELLAPQQRPLSYSAIQIAGNEDQSAVLNAIPIKLNYQVDIYTKYMAEADEYLRDFIFRIVNTPGITITIPYNGMNYPHNATMVLESMVSDNSDIKERLIRGQFTRLTFKFSVDDAYLWSIPFMDNWKIKINEPTIIDENEKET